LKIRKKNERNASYRRRKKKKKEREENPRTITNEGYVSPIEIKRQTTYTSNKKSK